jgi:hypothetical protein
VTTAIDITMIAITISSSVKPLSSPRARVVIP